MTPRFFGAALLAIGLLTATGCSSGSDPGPTDPGSSDAGSSDAGSSDAGSSDAGSSDAGSSDAGSSDAGSSDAGSSDAGSSDAGSSDAGTPARDSDCDGLSDETEETATYDGQKTDPNDADTDQDGLPDGLEVGVTTAVEGTECIITPDLDPATNTSPVNADTDGDGLPDGVEDANHDGKVDATETNPTLADTDEDGLPDGLEDANHNGQVDVGETNPLLADTDGDGLSDGEEDANHNGQVDTNETNPLHADTDCDGLSDGTEVTVSYDGVKTDPTLADTDQDGLPDGLEVGVTMAVEGTECVITPDMDVTVNTSPVNADTDGDGLIDGVEDANHDGKVDATETHPLLADTDCDGLIDGPSTASLIGEDQNADGIRQPSETDPLVFDTDGDGLSDGLELGATVNLDEVRCAGIFIADADPSTTTDATLTDTDGDGVSDGEEDFNQNGRVDPGELDPNDDNASGPMGQVCMPSQVRPVTFQTADGADLKLTLPSSFTEVTQLVVGSDVMGLVGYDSAAQSTFLALSLTPPAGATDPLGDEEALRPLISSKGALRNRTARTFTTWDGFAAVQAIYAQAGASTDLNQRTNDLIDALLPGSTGRLNSAAGVAGDFRLQTLFVHRSPQSLVVLIALAPLNGVTGANRSSPAVFNLNDLADGSVLAQFDATTEAQCERFALPTAKVDLLFVVDDSGSMADSQMALSATVASTVSALNAASLDWRVAMVTSSYHFGSSSNSGKLRPFTRNVNKLVAWLEKNSVCTSGACTLTAPVTSDPATCPSNSSQGANGGCWVGVAGHGTEGVLGAARKAVDAVTPGTDPTTSESPTLAREDAALVIVLLGDADDQTSGPSATINSCGTGGSPDKAGSDCEAVANFTSFFGDRSGSAPANKTGKQITVHGIVCPSGQVCGCTAGATCDFANGSREFNPQPENGVSMQRHAAVINASGGVLGSIQTSSSIAASMEAITNDVIGKAGHRTVAPPLGTSIKVAVANVQDPAVCTSTSDLPRSRVHGYDISGGEGTITFYGACRPASETTEVAVSYRSWLAP